jgi:hypothetical protein
MAARLRLLDTRAMPWEEFFGMPGMRMKELARDDDGHPDTYLCWGPPGPLLPESMLPYRHYHRTVRECMYVLAGELPHHEWDAPEDVAGHPTRYLPGYFMDRPPGSIHGVGRGRPPQVGRVHLDWRSGPGVWPGEPGEPEETLTVPPPAAGDPAVAAFARAPATGPGDPPGTVYARADIRILDTGAMPWQESPLAPGAHAKTLARGDDGAPVAELVWLAPGHDGDVALPGERRRAFVLQGELLVSAAGETLRCGEGFFADHPAGAPDDGLDALGTGVTGATLLTWR